MRLPFVIAGSLLAVIFLCSPVPLYGNGLVAIHREPFPEIAAFGFFLSSFLALAGLTIGFRRTGFGALRLLLASILAVLTVFVCLWFVYDKNAVDGAFVCGPIGLLLSSPFVFWWYRAAARKGVSVRRILTLFAYALVIAILCLIVLRLSIVDWVDLG